MTLANLALAGHLAAVGLVGGIWALVNATSNTKYVCADTSDTYVMSARWLDAGQFTTAFATSCMVLYRQWTNNRPTPQFAVLVEVRGALGVLIYLILVVTTASVCGNDKCITDAAVSESGRDPARFQRQASNMAGVSQSSTSTYPCGNQLDPTWFDSPTNYCPIEIAQVCGQSDDGSSGVTAERCLVFACSSQVPGVLERYILSMICLLAQILATVVLAVHVRRNLPAASISSPEDEPLLSTDAEQTQPVIVAGPAPSVRKRNRAIPYSSPNPNLAF